MKITHRKKVTALCCPCSTAALGALHHSVPVGMFLGGALEKGESHCPVAGTVKAAEAGVYKALGKVAKLEVQPPMPGSCLLW